MSLKLNIRIQQMLEDKMIEFKQRDVFSRFKTRRKRDTIYDEDHPKSTKSAT